MRVCFSVKKDRAGREHADEQERYYEREGGREFEDILSVLSENRTVCKPVAKHSIFSNVPLDYFLSPGLCSINDRTKARLGKVVQILRSLPTATCCSHPSHAGCLNSTQPNQVHRAML